MILGGDSDGIVPVTSQLNGLSADAPSIRIFPAIHSQGARDLGFGVPDIGHHLQQEESGIPEVVIDLLNTSITSDTYILLPQ